MKQAQHRHVIRTQEARRHLCLCLVLDLSLDDAASDDGLEVGDRGQIVQRERVDRLDGRGLVVEVGLRDVD